MSARRTSLGRRGGSPTSHSGAGAGQGPAASSSAGATSASSGETAPRGMADGTAFFLADEVSSRLRQRGSDHRGRLGATGSSTSLPSDSRRHGRHQSSSRLLSVSSSASPSYSNPLAAFSAVEVAPAVAAPATKSGSDGEAPQQQQPSLGFHPIFASYDAVGVEGAEAFTAEARSKGATGDTNETWSEEGQLLGMQLPLASVLSCLAREQRQAFNNRELVHFAPFFCIFLLFIFVGHTPATHIVLNAEALRAATDFDAKWLAGLEEQLLLEVFRVDTEETAVNASGDFAPGTSHRYPWLFTYYNETVNEWTTQAGAPIGNTLSESPANSTGASRSGSGGGSTVKQRAEAGGGTTAENGSAVDSQVERVARKYESVNVVRFASIRTKRDLMRWLLGPFLENLWDCTNPDHSVPWFYFHRGSQRRVGAVRLSATRAPTERPAERRAATRSTGQEAPGWCRRPSLRKLKNLPCSDITASTATKGPSTAHSGSTGRASDSWSASASSSSSTSSSSSSTTAPPVNDAGNDVGKASSTTKICVNVTNPALPDGAPLVRLVDGDDATGRAEYEVDLPFPATCHEVSSALRALATPIRSEDSTIRVEELWSRYLYTTSEDDDSCASFFFHPRTTALRVSYVVYGAAVNEYYLVDMQFRFAAAGSVVVPEVRVLSAPALSWRYNFTSLALSIALGVVLVVYTHHTVTAYMAVFARKRVRWERRGWGGVATAAQRLLGQGRACARVRPGKVTGLMVALQDLLRMRSVSHLGTLALTTAALGVYWWSWSETGTVNAVHRPLSYGQRLTYPESLQSLCERTAPLHTRLFAASTFFVFLCIVRFSCGLFSGLGLVVECLVEAMGRLLPLVVLWLWLAIACAVMGMCIYGATASEQFSDFSHAFLSLLVMCIDRGKRFWTDERRESGFNSMLPSVYGGLMQAEGRPAGHVQSYRWSTMVAAAGRQTNGLWLFFVIYIEVGLFFTLVAAVITEAFHHTLDSGPNGNKEGVGLEHHQRQVELAVRHARRCLLCWPYIKEQLARLLWARARVTVLADSREQLQVAQALHSEITYMGLLWLLPRALQAEIGPHQLRRWWIKWAEELQAQQRARRTWERRQWLRHWDQQPTGLCGWLQRVVPDEAMLENRAAQLNTLLEDLPSKIARHAEGVARR